MTALKDLLADPDQKIAFVAELTYREPDTDTTSTVRITSENWEGTESGYLAGLLDDPGDQSVEVEVDGEAGIGAASLSPMRFLNFPPSNGAEGPLDFLRPMTLGNRKVTLFAGSPDEPIANYEELGTGFADGEPEFDDEAGYMTLRRKTALELLRQDLDVGTYVGEPGALSGLTATGVADTSDDAAHHLTDFTLAGRLYHPLSTSAVTPFLSSRRTSATAENWSVRLQTLNTVGGGKIVASYSSGGVAAAVDLRSDEEYDDGVVHWWAFARRSGHAYLMVDGEIVAQTTTAPDPDTPTAGIAMGRGFQSGPGWINDNRILDHYIPPDEARAWMATRASGDEEGLVGLWRADEATGSTLTDYSPTAAHATIAGTENVDFEHVSSDLGEPEIAGQSMLAVIGSVIHFMADLVSSVFERWRVNDRDFVTTPQKTIRDEGDELTISTDYAWAGAEPIVALVAEAGEPLTARADLLGAGLGPNLLEEVLVTRGPLASADLDFAPWHSLIDAAGGIYTRRRSVGGIAGEILRGSMGHLASRRDGKLRADMMISPASPSPRDGPCVEIINGPATLQNGGIEWPSPAGALSGRDYTLALWIKTLRLGPGFGASPIMLMDLAAATGSSDGTQWYLDIGGTTPVFKLDRMGGGGIAASARATYGSILQTGWYFVALVHDHSGGETRFYAAPEGGTVALVGTDGDLSYGAAPASNGVQIGGVSLGGAHVFRGSVFEPSAWNGARSLSELQAQMDDGLTGGETGLAFYAPLNGTSSLSLTDTVGSALGSITADEARERPDAVIDLRIDPRPIRRRNLQPARRIEVRWRRNYAELTPDQIAPTVPDDERLDLQQGYRSDIWSSEEVAEDYLDAREIVLETPWTRENGARATMRLARDRFAPGREYAALGPDPGSPLRAGLLLEIGDEVRLYGHDDLQSGPAYRVASNRRIIGALDCQLGLLR